MNVHKILLKVIFFLILKSLYFKSKITCNRLPVYFNVYFGEGRPGCCVECFTFRSTQQHRGINCVTAADAGHSSCESSMVSCSEMHSNTIHFLELNPYSGDVLNMRELSPSPLVPSYVEVSLLNLEQKSMSQLDLSQSQLLSEVQRPAQQSVSPVIVFPEENISGLHLQLLYQSSLQLLSVPSVMHS